MPYWSIYCLYCGGYIADALLECIPVGQRACAAFQALFHSRPGAALACPYCNSLIGFDAAGQPRIADSRWPVFRYGRKEIELKRQADGEPDRTSLTDWALRHRFTQPGTHLPLSNYSYAEDRPTNEIVP